MRSPWQVRSASFQLERTGILELSCRMAEGYCQNTAGGPSEPIALAIQASKIDDVSLISQAISVASDPSSKFTAQDITQRGLNYAATRNATRVLAYLLEHGADVTTTAAAYVSSQAESVKPSYEVLDVLLTYGWDINSLGPNDEGAPLLWHAIKYPDLVEWCLNNGSKVDVPNIPPKVSANGTYSFKSRPRPPILEIAASSGIVETFELLRSRGASLGERTLHRAVKHAAILSPRADSDRNEIYTRRMGMVRHIVDVDECDVNTIRHEYGSHCTTPLCYVAARRTQQDFRELVWFLLDRGADPNLDAGFAEDVEWPSPLTCAQWCGNVSFLNAVKEWQARQQHDDAD